MTSALLCLFDVDGTLVHVAEEIAFAQAFREQCGPAVDLSFTPGLVVSDTAYVHDVLTRAYGRPQLLELSAPSFAPGAEIPASARLARAVDCSPKLATNFWDGTLGGRR
jgi:hypothetical protein